MRASIFHLILFGLILPAAALMTRSRMRRSFARLSRTRFYAAQLAQMALLTGISLYVASLERIPLFPAAVPPPTALALGAVILAGNFAIGYPLVREAVTERQPIVWLLMPSNAAERALWIAIAFMAGFGEEISWRGVQTVLLSRYAPNLLTACGIAVVMFAAAHAVQSAKSIAAVALFATSFHVLVWISGSLYVAMAVHFLYDAAIGFVYARLAKAAGYDAPLTGEAPVPITPADLA